MRWASRRGSAQIAANGKRHWRVAADKRVSDELVTKRKGQQEGGGQQNGALRSPRDYFSSTWLGMCGWKIERRERGSEEKVVLAGLPFVQYILINIDQILTPFSPAEPVLHTHYNNPRPDTKLFLYYFQLLFCGGSRK